MHQVIIPQIFSILLSDRFKVFGMIFNSSFPTGQEAYSKILKNVQLPVLAVQSSQPTQPLRLMIFSFQYKRTGLILELLIRASAYASIPVTFQPF